MKKLSKGRIRRLLKSHCLMVTAEFFRHTTDQYGDITGSEKYAEHSVYFSQLLHRYNPYVGQKVDNENTVYARFTPMAILPYDKYPEIKEYDTVRIDGKEYTISFCEDIKGYYCLLSLIAKE